MPSPLAPRLRRTTRHNWAAVVPYISKIKLSLDPTADGTKGMRVLHQQAQSGKMRSFYPKCEVVMELKDGAHPAVAAEFVNGDKMEFECKWMDMYEITDKLQGTAWDIKRADELAGDYREVHNVPTDGR